MFNNNITYKLVPLKDNKDTLDPERPSFDAKCLDFGKGLTWFETPIQYVKDFLQKDNQNIENIQIPEKFEAFAYTNANILIRDKMDKFGIAGYYKIKEIK